MTNAPLSQPVSWAGPWLVLAAAVLWGVSGLFYDHLHKAGWAPLTVAFWRAALAGAMFLVHAAILRQLALRRRADLAWLAGFAPVGVTLFYASLPMAVAAGGVSLAYVLLYTAPAWVVLFAWLLLRERITRHKLGVTAMTLAGVGLIVAPVSDVQRVVISADSISWGLLAGLTYASYYIFGKWFLAQHPYPPATVFAVILPLGAVGLAPMAQLDPVPSAGWEWLVLLVVVSTWLAYWCYWQGIGRLDATRAAVIATVEPLVTVGLAAWLLGEDLGVAGRCGAALILAASILSARSTK